MMRTVTVCKGEQKILGALTWTEKPPWRIMLEIPGEETFESISYDLFECLKEIRLNMAPHRLTVCVAGARRDAWPSGMSGDMGGAALVYIHRIGRQPSYEDLVSIFSDASCEMIGSVDEQSEFVEQWEKSLPL
jgi:hypothetical protein